MRWTFFGERDLASDFPSWKIRRHDFANFTVFSYGRTHCIRYRSEASQTCVSGVTTGERSCPPIWRLSKIFYRQRAQIFLLYLLPASLGLGYSTPPPKKKNRGDALRCFCPWAPRTLDTPVTCVHLEAVAAVANAQLTSQDPTRQDCVSYHRAAVWTLDCVGDKWATEGNFVRKLFSRPTNTYAYPIECSTCTTKLLLRAKTVSMNITVFTRRKKRFMRSICIFDIKYAENSNSLPVFCGQQHRLRKHRWLTCFLLQCTKYDKLYCLLYFGLILLLC